MSHEETQEAQLVLRLLCLVMAISLTKSSYERANLRPGATIRKGSQNCWPVWQGTQPEIPVSDNRVWHEPIIAEHKAIQESSALFKLIVGNPPDPILRRIRVQRHMARTAARLYKIVIQIVLRIATLHRR